MEANGDSQAPATGGFLRPESSASSRSRYTPQSSNGSSANLQNRSQAGSRDSQRVHDQAQMERRPPPGTSLLQERLKEKKAARLVERRRSTDVEMPFDSSGVQSSPKLGASSVTGKEREGRPGSSGEVTVARKGMGAKEMEDRVSTLLKKNFDLKLKLEFYQKRQTDLEERLEVAEARINKQVDELAEMQAINEQLLAELETRDQALEEAVGIICGLEEKVDRLMREKGTSISFDMQRDSTNTRRNHGVESQSGKDSGASPSQRDDLKNATTGPMRPKVTSRHVPRMPSFLSDQSEGAEALRSLYLPNDQERQSKLSLPKLSEENRDESEQTDGMNSPRLSLLSESSFLSVYGGNGLALEGLDLDDGAEPGSREYQRHRKSISVEKWIDERAKAANIVPKRPSAPKAANLRIGKFDSIGDIIESSPLQRLEKLKHVKKYAPLGFSNESLPAKLPGVGGGKDQGSQHDNMRSTEMTAFKYQNGLPPTPDTISTSTLRMHKKSCERLSPGSSDRNQGPEHANADRRSMNSSLSNLLSARPHSAGETVTSRREGHGWDTVTQSEVTLSDEDGMSPSNFDPWIAMGREKPRPIQPPDMFTFDGEDDDGWGRDAMFNRDSSSFLPPLKRYERSDIQDRNPRSEDTVVASSNMRRSHSTDSSPRFPIPCPPLSQQVSPNPPERRSSLAAASPSEKRARKSARQVEQPLSFANVQPGLRAVSMNPIQPQNNPKRSRLTSRLFSLGRSEQHTNPEPLAPVAPRPIAPNNTARSQSFTSSSRRRRNSLDLTHVVEAMERASATPPPIARYPKSRDGNGNVGTGTGRPLSAASLESNLRERSSRYTFYDDGYGVDGAGDDRNGLSRGGIGNKKRDSKDSKSQGRKWFGLARGGSLRR